MNNSKKKLYTGFFINTPFAQYWDFQFLTDCVTVSSVYLDDAFLVISSHMLASLTLESWSCVERNVENCPQKTDSDFEKRLFNYSMVRYFYGIKRKILTENTSIHRRRHI